MALGPELPPAYTDDDKLSPSRARATKRSALAQPLWKPYAAMLDSKIADMNNVSSGAFADSSAALVLQRFVERANHGSSRHLRLNPPRRAPEGGEAMTVRALMRS